ncbi:enoyl-CoA hydratase/isomerase family protein [Aquincola sp. MAHUQ-54]|uniref:Enoyl-CoA hydratase/isomerase family protein n=1 Tax=Aquincola agrisoli TaxID=3119538 RepID=A0AAW9QCZ4_9BURK
MAIRYHVDGAIAHVGIDRPDKLNAMTLAMYEDLGRAFLRARDDDAVRVVLLRGAGDRAFCAGADLTESIPALAEGRFDISRWDDAHLKRGDYFKPVVAAIHGVCFGGGFELMLATDIRVASADAVFSLPEAGMGFVPAAGTLTRLVRQLPFAIAMELMLTAERFTAQRLAGIGLLNAVVPREALMETALGYARRIAGMGPTAVRVIKQAALTLQHLPLTDAFAAEARLAQQAFESLEARAGLDQFMRRQRSA